MHHNFADEEANGVAVTANPFDPSGLVPGFYINVQWGGDAEVVDPPPGVTSDEFIYQFTYPGQPIIFISHSNLILDGTTVLTPAQTYELGTRARPDPPPLLAGVRAARGEQRLVRDGRRVQVRRRGLARRDAQAGGEAGASLSGAEPVISTDRSLLGRDRRVGASGRAGAARRRRRPRRRPAGRSPDAGARSPSGRRRRPRAPSAGAPPRDGARLRAPTTPPSSSAEIILPPPPGKRKNKKRDAQNGNRRRWRRDRPLRDRRAQGAHLRPRRAAARERHRLRRARARWRPASATRSTSRSPACGRRCTGRRRRSG